MQGAREYVGRTFVPESKCILSILNADIDKGLGKVNNEMILRQFPVPAVPRTRVALNLTIARPLTDLVNQALPGTIVVPYLSVWSLSLVCWPGLVDDVDGRWRYLQSR